jgi:hypothetical protein
MVRATDAEINSNKRLTAEIHGRIVVSRWTERRTAGDGGDGVERRKSRRAGNVQNQRRTNVKTFIVAYQSLSVSGFRVWKTVAFTDVDAASGFMTDVHARGFSAYLEVVL